MSSVSVVLSVSALFLARLACRDDRPWIVTTSTLRRFGLVCCGIIRLVHNLLIHSPILVDDEAALRPTLVQWGSIAPNPCTMRQHYVQPLCNEAALHLTLVQCTFLRLVSKVSASTRHLALRVCQLHARKSLWRICSWCQKSNVRWTAQHDSNCSA